VSRRRPAIGALMLLVLLAGCATRATTGVENTKEMRAFQARAAYERGLKHMGANEIAAAFTAFREAIVLDDETATYHDALGVTLFQLRRADLALAQFERAVALDPNFANAVFHVGLALSDGLQRWRDALPPLRRAVGMPTLSDPQIAWQALGVAYLNLQQWSEAEGALRFAIDLDPQMSSAHYNLGLVLVAANRKDEARSAFRRARELAPESAFGQAAAERLKALGNGG
jgi:Tfp pilus assembly protein PilF